MTRFFWVGILLGVLLAACAGTAAASNSLTFTVLPPVTNSSGGSSSSPSGGEDAWAINASGQVAGYASLTPGGTQPPVHNAFEYSAGTTTDLNLGGVDGLASPVGWAFGINDSGSVVGQAYDDTNNVNGGRAFVTSGGTMISLDSYDTTSSKASPTASAPAARSSAKPTFHLPIVGGTP